MKRRIRDLEEETAIKHTKISSADQGIGSHYYFLYSRSEERAVGLLGS